MNEFIIQEGDVLQPDGWKPWSERITKSDGYKDSSFPGCQWRVKSRGGDYDLAINLTVTGRKSKYFSGGRGYAIRVKIEWVGDGEPSSYSCGWLFAKNLS